MLSHNQAQTTAERLNCERFKARANNWWRHRVATLYLPKSANLQFLIYNLQFAIPTGAAFRLAIRRRAERTMRSIRSTYEIPT